MVFFGFIVGAPFNEKNKKTRLKFLETSLVKTIPAVPLKLQYVLPPSRSNKRYPLTRADGSAWEKPRHFSSEVMGLVAPICQLTPNADSL